MKGKVLILSLFMSFLFVSLISCNQQETMPIANSVRTETVHESNALIDVKDSISLLNQQLGQNQSRSFFGRLFKSIFKVVVSDCVGAFNGLINGNNVWNSAVSSSSKAATTEAKPYLKDLEDMISTRAQLSNTPITSLINTDVKMDDLILNEDKSNLTLADSLGYFHNKIIQDAYIENNDINYWANLDDKGLVLKINEEVQKYVPVKINGDNDIESTATFCSFVGTTLSQANTAQEFLDLTKKNYPNLSNSIDVLSLYLNGMESVSTQEEWDKYCKDLVRIISNSNLDDSQKESLKAGVVVGYASSKLWKDGKD